MLKHIPRRSAVLALPVCVLALGISARTSTSQTFEEFTEVIEVQVPVNVVDKNGQPVRGLTAEDFEIFDGRTRQELTNFRVVDLDTIRFGGQVDEDGNWVEAPDRPLATSRGEVERAIPAEARRHFLLLFDLSFSSPSSVLRAREAAREVVINSLHPTDLVGVATHSVETGPRLVLTFTPDRAQLARAIDTLGVPRLVRQSDPLSFLLRGPTYDPDWPSPTTGRFDPGGQGRNLGIDDLTIIGQQMSRQEKTYVRGRIFTWAKSMGVLGKMLDSVKGRKHIIYFSEGFDGRLLLGRRPDSEDPEHVLDRESIVFGEYWMVDSDDTYGNVALQNEVAETLEIFRRSDCTIQAVDISGLRADFAEQERIKSVGQDSLFYIANDTGGEFFADANNLEEPLNSVLQHTTVTYLLGFQPSKLEADGSFHRLRVRVKADRGARVFHRKGYFAPRPFEDLHPFEKNLLAADAIASAAPRKDFGLSVLAAPFKAREDAAYVPIIIEVEGEGLLTQQKDEYLSVELYTYVTNERGEMRDFFTEQVGVDLSPGDQAFRRAGLKYYGHLELEPGKYLVRVLVRNATTGLTAVESVPVFVPEYGAEEPALLPPLFFDTGGGWVMVRQRDTDGPQRSVVYPFTVNGEPFVPAARPVLHQRQGIQFCIIGYNFGDGQLELETILLTEDGRVVEGGALELVERTITGIGGVDKLLATLELHDMKAGDYEFQVAVRNLGSGSIQTSSIPVSIVN